MSEALDKSVFYRALVGQFFKLFSEANDKCYLICIPQNSSLGSLSIDDKLIKSHVLKPSPLLLQNYLPINSTLVTNVEKEERTLIVTRKDSRRKFAINILSIEEGYNSKNQNYQILLIEKPLTASRESIAVQNTSQNNRQSSRESNATSDDLLVDFNDCLTYLYRLSPAITDAIQNKVDQISKTYIIVPKFLGDAAQRFQAVVCWAEERYEIEFPGSINIETMNSAVESLVMGLVHKKVFTAALKEFESDEKQLKRKLKELSENCPNLETLGTEPIFNSFEITTTMRNLLITLDNRITPLEKLNVLKNVLNMVSESLMKCIESERNPFDLTSKSVLPDDLVAATIFLVSQVQPGNLFANIRYIQTFSWHLPSKNEFGYSLVTFEVALEFIKNFNSSQLVNSWSPPSKTSPKEPRPRTYSFHVYNKQTSQFDGELEKITKLVERRPATIEEDQSGIEEAREVTPADDDLGEFLSGLASNQYIAGFGKQ